MARAIDTKLGTHIVDGSQ